MSGVVLNDAQRAEVAAQGAEVERLRAALPGPGSTSLSEGLIPLAPNRTRHTLPSGAIADVRLGKGKDLRLAARMVGDVNEPIYYEFALIAIKVQVNGRDVTIEEIEEMSDLDAAELMSITRGKASSGAKEAEKVAAQAPSQPST